MTRAVKPRGVQLDFLPRAVERPDGDLPVARHAPPDLRDAETAFPVFRCLLPDRRDLGVDQGEQRHVPLFVILLLFVAVGRRRESGNEEADALVHLRRRQADALVFLHRLEHVVDELLDAGRPDLGRVSGRALARRTGCPMRATFRIDMVTNYMRDNHGCR